VWRLDPSAPKDKQYTHFTSKDGLGDDNAYALACDKAGRVWAGTLNHGVSVFNGKQWKTYGVLDGPLGSRVFALAVSPKDGGVWGATEAGLFRYRADRWTYYTRADGLPSDQASSLAFSSDGLLYVGTQCDGIAVGSPDTDYRTWRTVPGPSQLPSVPTGKGLPSSLINCLLVASDNTIYAGTTCGLARSRDGDTWSFVRGADWKDKLAGLYHPVIPNPAAVAGDLLTEDYVTCLTEDEKGRIFVGHRQKGIEVLDPKTWKRVQSGADGAKPDGYVSGLLVAGRSTWVGVYGEGILTPDGGAPVAALSASEPPVKALALTAPPPTPAAPPTLSELKAMLRVVSAIVPDRNELQPRVVALDDDWTTQGDWLGRYGRYWACLNAICSPSDYLWGAGWEPVKYSSRIGLNAGRGDNLRYWVQWLYTNNPRVLEMPPTYLDSRIKKGLTTQYNNRREAEIDDHGEGYPQATDGPNLYTTLTVPQGLFALSLYDFNKDSHDWVGNRSRDYRLSVRAHSGLSLDDVSGFGTQPELAHGRIRDFWGGVWKRFLVRGPMTLTVEVNRNNSLNAVLPGVMLDLLDEAPPPYHGTVKEWEQVQANKEEQRQRALTRGSLAPSVPAVTEAEAAGGLADALETAQIANSSWWAVNRSRFYGPLLRWYAAHSTTPSAKLTLPRLATCYYQMGMYPQWEECQRQTALVPARDVEKALRWDGVSPDLRGQGFQVISAAVQQNHLAAKLPGK